VIELNFPNAVVRERDFYGRRLERQRIEGALLAGNPRAVVVLGERRIGKTSLQAVTARHVAEYDPERFVPLFLPHASAIRCMDDYAKEILQGLCSYLGKDLHETGLLDAMGQFKLASLGQFRDAAARLLRGVPNQTFVVCVDELDAILIDCLPHEANQIIGLTDYIIERSELPFIMHVAMAHLPQSMKKSFASPILASESEVIELGPMPEGEAIAMVRGLLLGHVELEEPAMRRLLQLSAGHPYFVKLLLDRLVTRYWRGTHLMVSVAMLEDIVPEATQDPRAREALANIYKVHFTPQEQQLVLLLAQRAGEVSEQELRLLGASFVTAAGRLDRRGYLMRSGMQHYDFRIQFVGYWLRNWEEFEEEVERLVPVHS
jgi:hypothetical protein